MAMTAQVKAELATIKVTKPCDRKSEVATTLRFANGLHVVSGKIVIEAELDTGAAARRLRTDIADVFGHSSDLVVVNGNGLAPRHALRRPRGQGRRRPRAPDRPGRLPWPSRARAARPGGQRRPLRLHRGLARRVPGPRLADRARSVDGARGHLPRVRRPRWPSSGRRAASGIPAKAREVRNVDRVVVRDGDAIAALLTHLGAHDSLMAWEERRMRREVRASANRLANFDDANLRRSARAAVAAGARVERALEILGDDVPEHLRIAGNLRVEHQQASLEELGQLHTPQLTKDAVAGRIRRLLATADKKAAELGHPEHRGVPDVGHARRLRRRVA